MKYLFLTLIVGLISVISFVSIKQVNLRLATETAGSPLNSISEPVYMNVNSLPVFPPFLSFQLTPPAKVDLSIDKPTSSLVLKLHAGESFVYNTAYLAEVKYFGRSIGEFRFTTPARPEVKALEVNDKDIAENYPLAAYLPFEKEGLTLDYSAPKTLRVRGTSSQSTAEKFAQDYAAYHHVDIAGHRVVVE